MAVAHSAASESHTGTTGSTNQAAFSWTHTQTGTPQGVVVFVSTFVSTASLVTSVTYGGVALTRLSGGSAQDAAGELGRMDAFFLGSGLGTGNQTITVNRTNNATVMYAAAATVTAGAATAVPTATIVLLQGDGTLTVQSVDDTSPGQNSVRYAGGYSGLAAPPAAGTGSTLLNSIDIGAYGSALVRETTAGQGARNVGFNAATDDRAVVHLAIRELVPRTETPIVGAFTLTGNDVTLTVAGGLNNYNLPVDAGTVAFTGNDATLRQNYAIAAETGAFTVASQPATLRHNPRIEASTGAFVLNGQPATLLRSYRLTAETGTFSATGQPATLRHNTRIEAATGSFALTGGAPVLLRGRYLSGGSGAFIETGQPATFRRTWAITATAGAFTFTGNAASLTEIGAYEIDPIVGSFALTGQSAQLAQSRTLSVDAGTFALTGNTANTRHNASITGDRGQFFLPERNLRPWSESFEQATWTTNAASITANATTAPDGTLTADALIENTTQNVAHTVGRNFTYVAGRTYTASCYFKLYPGPTTRYARLQLGNATVFPSDTYINVNLATGTIFSTVGSPSDSGITSVGNGWYRAWLTKQYTGAGVTFGPVIQIITTAGPGLYANADGLSGIYIWGAQFEEGSISDYDPTGPVAATRTDTRHNVRIDGGTGTFVLSGSSPTVARSYSLRGDAGTFIFTGQPATFARTRAIAADTGTFNLTGNPTALTEVGAYEIAAATAAFVLVGNAAQLSHSRVFGVDAGVLAFTGNNVTLSKVRNVVINADRGIFAFSGNNAAFARNRNVDAFAGQFIVSGNNVNLSRALLLNVVTGSIAFSGLDVSLEQNAALTLSADLGSFSLTGGNASLAKSGGRRRNVLIF